MCKPCLALLIVTLAATAAPAQSTWGWKRSPLNGHDYYMTTGGYLWDRGEALAQRAGGHLATIRSRAESDWIFTTYVPTDAHFLIGFNDRAVEGEWVWTSGEPVTWTNWAPGEPNNTNGDEHICRVYADVAREALWNDISDGRAYRCLFEVESTPGIERFGHSTPACDDLIFINALRAPVAGDPWFALTCAGAPSDSAGFLFLSSARLQPPLQLFGVRLWIDPFAPVVFSVPVQSTSRGEHLFHLPLTAATRGLVAYLQYGWLNSPSCGGWTTLSTSDALRIEVQ